ncbi:hypothetical protein [Paraburkholderia solisilvae]|uniref:Uncharacterized protein n=1 Tax=Paraburkholderia solisilvae TaxID=624376 RepID=A0A6J5E1S5_9BURK|nr:hypothetical protein [Paraburkholderia solisilvae]CAB3759331.1 hypothetical protein LMG29739_03126 [Paraburkholderia solisilvae]
MNYVIEFAREYGVVIVTMAVGWVATQLYLRYEARARERRLAAASASMLDRELKQQVEDAVAMIDTLLREESSLSGQTKAELMRRRKSMQQGWARRGRVPAAELARVHLKRRQTETLLLQLKQQEEQLRTAVG